MTLAPGTKLDRYEIRSKIGEGGMGEVYLAQDPKLDRKVALKVLPAELAANQQRMQRFVQEAKAASALNHPNILTIHEIGRVDSLRFIAMEYVEGETLRQPIQSRRMKFGQALDIAAQIASALVAAHQAGIVHRDIKPENVMLRRDRIVKVLDFGLAKLTESQSLLIDAEAPTKALVKTDPGVVMGTAQYMSPEQARGMEVDARTDIWSVGCLLYEMVTGHAPFAGATTSHVIVSVLEQEPLPLSRYSPEVPSELQRIVKKTLAKDREERYQTARDLQIDLKNLKRELEVQSERDRSSPQTAREAVAKPGSEGPAPGTKAAQTGNVGAARPTSSAEYLASEIKRHKRGVPIALGALAVVLTGLGYGLYKFFGQRKQAASFQTMKLTRLTTIGKISAASVSLDGKYIAYVVDEGDRQSLWIKQLAIATSNTQIVPPTATRYLNVTFSPDGNYIYYVRQEKGPSELYEVPVLGGPARKLMDAVGPALTFSPDGKQFAFLRARKLMIADADGTDEKQLTPGPCLSLSWSADGKGITCVSEDITRAVTTPLVEVRVADGDQRSIFSRQAFVVNDIAGLRDSSGLALAGREGPNQSNQLWFVSYQDGELRKITNDLSHYRAISVTADSGSLVAIQSEQLSNIWVAPIGDASRARQITSGAGKQEGASTISWSPDGKIVYVSLTASGRPSIWVTEADGTGQRQLTDGSYNAERPAVSPDGRYVVFESDRAGSENIWRIDIDGTNLKRLTDGGFDILASCSPDGHWVIYSSEHSARGNLWKVPIDGGTPVQLTNAATARGGIVSPDGKFITCWYVEQSLAQSGLKIAVIPFEGGEPIKSFDLQPTAFPPPGPQPNYLRWTGDSRAVLYIDTRGGVSNIWMQPVDGSAPKQLTDFKSDHIFSFDYSHDGKQLALSRGTLTSDVVLISNFR